MIHLRDVYPVAQIITEIARPSEPSLVHIVGAAETGKTLLALALAAGAIRAGGSVLYADWMNGLAPEWLATFGIEFGTDQFMLLQPSDQASGLDAAFAAIEGGVRFVVLDGMGEAPGPGDVLELWAEALPRLEASGATVLTLQAVRAPAGPAVETGEPGVWASVRDFARVRLTRAASGSRTVDFVRLSRGSTTQGSFGLPD